MAERFGRDGQNENAKMVRLLESDGVDSKQVFRVPSAKHGATQSFSDNESARKI